MGKFYLFSRAFVNSYSNAVGKNAAEEERIIPGRKNIQKINLLTAGSLRSVAKSSL